MARRPISFWIRFVENGNGNHIIIIKSKRCRQKQKEGERERDSEGTHVETFMEQRNETNRIQNKSRPRETIYFVAFYAQPNKYTSRTFLFAILRLSMRRLLLLNLNIYSRSVARNAATQISLRISYREKAEPQETKCLNSMQALAARRRLPIAHVCIEIYQLPFNEDEVLVERDFGDRKLTVRSSSPHCPTSKAE